MTQKLSEWRIVSAAAEEVCQRVTRKIIRDLQELKDVTFGDDSCLTNAWEEICFQLQGEKSFYWDAYDLTVRQTIEGEVSRLAQYEREAVWLQTPAGEDWDEDDEELRHPYPVADDDIVEYLKDMYVYSAATDWSNKRIRKYLQQSFGHDESEWENRERGQ